VKYKNQQPKLTLCSESQNNFQKKLTVIKMYAQQTDTNKNRD